MCCGCRPPIVTAEAPVQSGGWVIATGFAALAAARDARSFYAVYPGDAFGNAERGVLAAMAWAHTQTDEAIADARDSAQLAVHGLAEGFYGAGPTLSPRRAVGVALAAVNAWTHAQIRAATRRLVPVSLSALVFCGPRVGLVQIGGCRLYRLRGRTLAPLMQEHMRAMPDGSVEPTRAVGLDVQLSVDFAEDDVQPADRYVLVSGLEDHAAEALYAALAARLEGASLPPGDLAETLLAVLGHSHAPDKAAMVLDVLAVPAAPADAQVVNMTDLPLRPEPREGDVWDGFVIGRTLYRGQYTVLKAAHDTLENREVALKIPLPTMLTDEIFTAGFMREAWIGAAVRGPGIVRYLNLPADRRSSLYLVMPLYAGETLEARLMRAPLVSLPEGLGIALKLCEAVQALAAIQIVHRDIKPENIMLLADNEVRLLDLGLAYLPGIDMQGAARPGGTIRYMAPELLRGTAANARSEVFALAVTIYRMFSAGPFPFGQREPVPLARLRPDLPGWLGAVLGQALSTEPAARFADAGALAAALQRGLIGGLELMDRPRSLPLWRRVWVWQMIAAGFALGFFGLLARALR